MLGEYFYIQLSTTELLLPLEHTEGAVSLTSVQICPIPGIPNSVLGVVNQRGKLLWVLELSNLLGLGQTPRLTPKYNFTAVVLTDLAGAQSRSRSRQVACVVSFLKGIVVLNREQFKPVPADYSPLYSSFLSGVVEIEQSLVSILNVNAVFNTLANLDNLVSS